MTLFFDLFDFLRTKKARENPSLFLYEILLAQLLNLMKHLIDLSATTF